MMFLKRMMAAAMALLLFGNVQAGPVKPRLFVSHFENVLGTSLEVKVAAVTEQAADAAENAALTEITRLNDILSGYDRQSEFSRWLRTANRPVAVSKELFEVLSLFDQWRNRSGGALNASAEVVNAAWKKAAKEQREPAADELRTAVNAAQQQQWALDAGRRTATHLSEAPLVLNSFAKSYIIQRAADAAMASSGVHGVAINIGGDIVLKGQLSEPVMITNPQANAENDAPLTGIIVGNKAIATSGNYRRGVLIGDKWYSHIVDPRTGLPASEVISATVVAPEATDAGALATAFNVLTPEESKQLAATIPGAEYLIITKSGERIESDGWHAMELPATNTATAEKKADWTSNYEVAINFEIALIEGTRIRRPFVAIWIEDDKGTPVRNISVWYNRERWLPDLKLWHRNYFQAFNAEGSTLKTSVSSATRSPGKYTMKWDGKDDKGEVVKPGKYTVVIEAVREHGTYQLMKQEIAIKKKPNAQTFNLTGNVEIAAASVELRKRTGK
jgi:thiamine biosynthesis lipoprotein ApbE